MRQLLLMRHAKSAWNEPSMPDHARPLNGRGRRAAAAMREAIQGLGLQPDVILVSSARRTLQTLAALEPWDETPLVEPRDALYLADAAKLLAELRGAPEFARSLMLIGHNPGLHELAMLLAGPLGADASRALHRLAAGYPSGALTEFSVARPWRELAEGGARLTRFLEPRDLPGGA